MPKKKLSPADLIVARFGGVRVLGRLSGKSPSTFTNWRKRNKGKIPNGFEYEDPRGTHAFLLSLAEKQGIELTAEELINGGYV